MENALPPDSQARAVFRVPVAAARPVQLLFSLEGEHIDPVVEDIGAEGARFFTTQHFDKLYTDQVLGPAVLLLPHVGMTIVYPVIKWMSFPQVGVQFTEMNDKDREMISRFMFNGKAGNAASSKPESAEEPLK